MSFQSEPTHYAKGILPDLQGTWSCLRQAIVDLPSSEIQHRLIFHMDEGMSLESVRDLNQMQKSLLLITNIVRQENLTQEITEYVEDIHAILDDLLTAIKNGERI